MSGVLSNILAAIGNTPLVKINSMNQTAANILAKVEYLNPGGSTKDRVALNMIEQAEARGILKPGATIVEPTSGNTGIGLAMVAAIKGYRLILTMPDTMSIERRKLLAAYGAELVLTDGSKGMSAAIDAANAIIAATPGSWMPQQFENEDNPSAHSKTTAAEILNDCGTVDVFVACFGTGGTITGVARALKATNPKTHIVGIEPYDSPLLSKGKCGPHRLQGIGANFIPRILDRSLIDEIIPVKDVDAGKTAREAARREGLLVGITSGAAIYAALQVAKRPEYAGKNIVALLPDSGERYLSGWLFEE